MRSVYQLTGILFFLLILGKRVDAGGFILTGQNGATGLNYLQEKSQSVNVLIHDQSALTTVEQVFYNSTGRRLEGYFIFPIPKGANLSEFKMEINGKMTEGEFLDAQKARTIYENIVRSMKDPALMEYSENGLFRVRIFPIEPNSEKRIKLSYSEVLQKDNGNVFYEYALKGPKGQKSSTSSFSLKAEINSRFAIKNVYCPSHQVEMIRKSENQVVSGFEGNTGNSGNFQLFYRTDDQPFGLSLLCFKETNDQGYFFADISPGFAEDHAEIQKDVTFVLDVSGSMAGEKLDQAKKALAFCVNNLNEDDCFELIRFSTEANSLFGDMVPANPENIQKARDFIDGFRAIGGTNIEEALTMALGSKTTPGRPHMIVFVTDGKPTIGEINDERLVNRIKDANSSETRIFTFGIGNEINTHLLDRFTEETNAFRTYATPQEDLEIKLSSFFTKISSPVLTNVSLNFPGDFNASEIYPKHLPDLFNGSSLVVMGRYDKSGNADLVLEGEINGEKKTYRYKMNFDSENRENDFIPPLWATRAVGYLLDQIRLHGENPELRDEVVRIARTHGIITPYTSYLILEDERSRPANPEQIQTPTVLHDQSVVEESEAMHNAATREKSGSSSVKASKEIQDMKQVESRSSSDGSTGSGSGYEQAVKNIKGKVFYRTTSGWVDTEVGKTASKEMIRVKFGSNEYFNLLKKLPEALPFFSVGSKVKFVFGKNIIEVYE